jgi:hypothetical protein
LRKRVKAPFDPKKFLAKVGDGKTIAVGRVPSPTGVLR